MANRKPLVLDTNGYYGQIPDTDSLIVLSASFIGNAILIPVANGAVQIGATGNARGTYSVDLQQSRSGVAMVASGNYSGILSGQNNYVDAIYACCMGGDENHISGQYSNIFGGQLNIIGSGGFCVIVGGYQNDVNGSLCTIGGGDSNTIIGRETIGGGRENSITSGAPTSYYYCTIIGGYQNTKTGTGTYNTITGGYSNSLTAGTSAGGSNVLSGHDNSIQGGYCVVAGGYSNDIVLAAGAIYSTIMGGCENTINQLYNVIAGGFQNTLLAPTDYSVILGGRQNGAVSYVDTIAGGYFNTIPVNCGTYNTMTGGYSNTCVAASTSNGSNVLGGYDNSMQGQYSVVAGYSNDIVVAIGARYINISGGYANDITTSYVGTIVGGYSNSMTGTYDYVGGGKDNHITAPNGYQTICGGKDNSITANNRHSILGGLGNSVASYTGTNLGGHGNTNRFTWSTTIGAYADTDHAAQVSQASGQFDSVGDAQTVVLMAARKTTDATPSLMYCRPLAAGYMDIIEGTSWYYTVKLIARQTNGDYTVSGWRAEGLVHHSIGGNPTIANNSYEVSFVGDAAWVFAVGVNTTQLILTVTGKAGENITWVARVELVQVID
jgi:hypothetical protein